MKGGRYGNALQAALQGGNQEIVVNAHSGRSNAETDREESQSTGSRDVHRNHQDGPETPLGPRITWGLILLEGTSWVFRNISFNVNVGGLKGGTTPTIGSRSAGTSFG